MARLIILRGYPGSGKTTLGKSLQEAGYGRFIDHNQILTFVASIVGNDDKIYDDIASLEKAMTRKLLLEKHNVIVARGFSSTGSVNQYINLAKSRSAKHMVFRLDAPAETLAKRVQAPERLSDFNPTVTPEALHDWVQGNPIEPIPDEIIVNANPPLDDVLRNIIRRLKDV